MKTFRLPPWATGLIGGTALIAFWWISALTVFSNTGAGVNRAIPTPPEVIIGFADSGFEFYWRNFSVTLVEAAQGYLWGNGLALLLAALVLIVPRLEGAVMQLAIITYCVPIVAIGPLALIIIGAPSAGEPSGTAVFLAALSVFFTTVVGSLLGLKAADAASLDVVTVYGGTHAWVVLGYKQTWDRDEPSKKTLLGLYVSGPLGTTRDRWPYKYMTVAQFREVFTRYHEWQRSVPWEGKWVVVAQ